MRLKTLAKSNQGQIVVEYVLLLTIAVAIAVLITSTMIKRSGDTPGFLVSAWNNITTTIGLDLADDIAPQ